MRIPVTHIDDDPAPLRTPSNSRSRCRPTARQRCSAAKQSRIWQMRKDGVSYAQIAKKLGLWKTCVYRYANA